MNIKPIAEKLCREHSTQNPFAIAKALNILVVFEPLGKTKAYFNYYDRQKFIHINQDLSENDALFACAHELGHAVLHPDINTPFMRMKTLHPVSKFESQANMFAVLLLYSDEYLQPFLECSITQVADALNISVPLAEYRMKQVEPILY